MMLAEKVQEEVLPDSAFSISVPAAAPSRSPPRSAARATSTAVDVSRRAVLAVRLNAALNGVRVPRVAAISSSGSRTGGST